MEHRSTLGTLFFPESHRESVNPWIFSPRLQTPTACEAKERGLARPSTRPNVNVLRSLPARPSSHISVHHTKEYTCLQYQQQHGVGHYCSTTPHTMMRSASFVASDQSPTFTVGENQQSAVSDDISISGSDDEDVNGDTPVNGSKKRKRSHVKISYVAFLSFRLL
jgi:hypothetical protein